MPKYLSEITPDDLVQITRLGNLGFTPREVAIMLELDIQAVIYACEDDSNDVYKAFHGGRLQREVDLNEKIFKLADSGSSPAQTMALEILKKQQIKMMDR